MNVRVYWANLDPDGTRAWMDVTVVARHLCFFVLLDKGMSPQLIQKTLQCHWPPGPHNRGTDVHTGQYARAAEIQGQNLND